MASRFRFLGILLGMAFAAGASAQAQPPATQSLSSSLGVVVFPAKGQSAQQQQKDTFNKGFAACLEAKGYTVK